MDLTALRREWRISKKAARCMILDMARFGDNSHRIPFDASERGIEAWFAENGVVLDKLAEECRDFSQQIMFVENLVGPDFQSRDAVHSMSTFHSQFNAMERSLARCIADGSHQDLYQAAATGIAAVETFFSEQVDSWNREHPTAALTDHGSPFMTFAHKIGNWLPQITGGKVYDRSREDWDKFMRLRQFRDDQAIHSKSFVENLSFEEIADYCNLFPHGIALTLKKLHYTFGLRIPCPIIRGIYAPPVGVQYSSTA